MKALMTVTEIERNVYTYELAFEKQTLDNETLKTYLLFSIDGELRRLDVRELKLSDIRFANFFYDGGPTVWSKEVMVVRVDRKYEELMQRRFPPVSMKEMLEEFSKEIRREVR